MIVLSGAKRFYTTDIYPKYAFGATEKSRPFVQYRTNYVSTGIGNLCSRLSEKTTWDIVASAIFSGTCTAERPHITPDLIDQSFEYKEVLAGKPVNFNISEREDFHTFGTILNSVSRALAILGPSLSDGKQETNVHHFTIKGTAYDSTHTNFVERNSFTGIYDGVTTISLEDSPTSVDENNFPITTGSSVNWSGYSLESIVKHLARRFDDGDLTWSQRPNTVQTYDSTVTSFEVEYRLDGSVSSIKYSTDFIHVYLPLNITTAMSVNSIIEFTQSSWLQEGEVTDSYYPNYTGGVCKMRDDYTHTIKNYYNACDAGIEVSLIEYEVPSMCLVTGIGGDNRHVDLTVVGDRMREYWDWVHKQRERFLSSAYVSSTTAISDFDKVIEANYLESISEIGEIYQLIPDRRPFLDFMRKIGKAGLFTNGVKLLDLATNNYLLLKFGLLPFASDLAEISSKLDEVQSRFQARVGRRQTLYGKFTYTFPDNDVLSGLRLVTRSKVRIGFPPQSFYLAMLPLKRLGLEPSFANLWDLVPFSFVADWFVNFGMKYDAGYNAGHIATAAVEKCVHSYSIYRTVDGHVIPPIVSSEVDMKYYLRIKSNYFPTTYNGHYDWLSDPPNPPILIGGSLLWVILRS